MTKVSSKRLAAIASKVLNNGNWSVQDVRALAASVLAQCEKPVDKAERTSPTKRTAPKVRPQ